MIFVDDFGFSVGLPLEISVAPLHLGNVPENEAVNRKQSGDEDDQAAKFGEHVALWQIVEPFVLPIVDLNFEIILEHNTGDYQAKHREQTLKVTPILPFLKQLEIILFERHFLGGQKLLLILFFIL